MPGFSRIFPEQLRDTKIRYGVAAETVAVDPTLGAEVLLRVLLSAVHWVLHSRFHPQVSPEPTIPSVSGEDHISANKGCHGCLPLTCCKAVQRLLKRNTPSHGAVIDGNRAPRRQLGAGPQKMFLENSRPDRIYVEHCRHVWSAHIQALFKSTFRQSADRMTARPCSRHRNDNWKPWQTSISLLLSILLAGVILLGILLHLVQRSKATMSPSLFRDKSLAWYANASTDPAADIQGIKNIQFDLNVSADCLKGLVDLDTSSGRTHFFWNFLPSVLAGVWGLVDSEVKRIEPFYQASRPGGASAQSCLFAEYITLPFFLSPFQAIYCGH
jgi:hypothetical protein